MSERLVAIDFETANSEPCSACSIGLIVVENNKIIFEYESLIKPPKKYRDFKYYNSKIHGISEADVQDAPYWPDIYTDIKPYLTNSTIVAHNAMFDIGVMMALNEYFNCQTPSFHYFCTVELAQKWLPNLDNHKLNTVSNHLQVSLDHHNAKSDAKAAMEIVLHALESCRCEDTQNLLEKYEMSYQNL